MIDIFDQLKYFLIIELETKGKYYKFDIANSKKTPK